MMARVFSEWRNKPLLAITKDKVTKLHTRLGKENGHAYANSAMRLLRALFNFAAGQYEDAQGHSLITDNPVPAPGIASTDDKLTLSLTNWPPGIKD